MIFDSIKKLIIYGLEKGLIEKEDVIYTQNMIIDTLGLVNMLTAERNFPILIWRKRFRRFWTMRPKRALSKTVPYTVIYLIQSLWGF